MLEVDGLPLRDLLIQQAGLKSRVRVYENGRRVQYSDSKFLTSPRLERVRTALGTVMMYRAAVAYEHVPRREYGPRDEPLLDKFMRKVDMNIDGHHYWTGHITRQGYGRFSLKIDGKNKTVGAHRWIFEQLVRPLEPGEVADHKNDICGIRHCVNIEHLEGVTHEENSRRGRVKLSLALREICNKNHVLAEVGTRIDEKGTVLCLECEKEKHARSNERFFIRRAIVCAREGRDYVYCPRDHRLDLENALLASGLCRLCHLENEQASRTRRKQASAS